MLDSFHRSGFRHLSIVFIFLMVSDPAKAAVVTDWISYASTTAIGQLGGLTISASTSQSAPYGGIFTDRFSSESGNWQAGLPLQANVEGLAAQPVNAGAYQEFSFSSPQNSIRLYIENFDSASDAVINASGATSITLLSSSSSISYSSLSADSGRIVTSNGGFDGQGDLVLEIHGSFSNIRLDYSNGIQNNAIFYTFVSGSAAPVPEPGSMVSAILVLAGLVRHNSKRHQKRNCAVE